MPKIEVVYINSIGQLFHQVCQVPVNSTVQATLIASCLFSDHPEAHDLPIGIFGKLVDKEKIVQEGDRIEIYRALTADPKEKRRQRAQNLK